MKKTISITILILLSTCTYGQAVKNNMTNEVNAQIDTILGRVKLINKLLAEMKFKEVDKERYKLYPTQNRYTFLKLDTQTGKINQVQWNLDDDKEYEITLSNYDYSYGTSVAHFELYPTQNMYQFIMLERTTGTVYHVQWGLEPSKRWVQIIR